MIDRRRDRWNLFLCSFTILFVELTCIRWIPAYIRYLGYFTNFVLLGSFLGIGLGILQARRRPDLHTFFPLTLAVLVGIVATFKLQLNVTSTQEVFFKDMAIKVQGTESFFLVPLIFALVTVLFALLGQNLGRLLTVVHPPLTAYTLDVAGSIAGSALFALVSFLSAPPGVWFALAAVAALALPQRRGAWRIANAAILLGVILWVTLLGRSSLWSPYYRIDLQRLRDGRSYAIFVNNIGHQIMGPYTSRAHALFYLTPFQTFHFSSSTRELIIGAGSGTDADMALHHGIGHITGVELDPTIYSLGRRLHPDHVYQNARVHVVVDDGRAFLEHTRGTYDLIVFALPDSLALTSSFANLRLESYLFTRESFSAARRHLSPTGVLILYNYYRQPWIVHKLAGMLTAAFHQAPYGRIYGSASAAVLMDGPRLRELPPAVYKGRQIVGQRGVDGATDDWPFLYLRSHSVPLIYLQGVAIVMALALVAVILSAGRSTLRRFDPALFFTGLAFLLLESKSIVNFSLLFGVTWVVNALVIIGILCTVLLANAINARSRLRLDLRLLYLGLAVTLGVNLLLPFHTLLVADLALRYALGCTVLFSPILMANLIFGRLFGATVAPDVALASNLLGAFVGGMLEYLSLQIGYHQLLLLVTAAYLLSFAAVGLRGRPTGGRLPASGTPAL